MIQPTRRNFLQSSLALGTAGVFASKLSFGAEGNQPKAQLKQNAVVLFQGDSITDAGRDRKTADIANDQSALGKGYAGMAATNLLVDHADKNLQVWNRGISGNKVFQLAERWDTDCLELKPDVLSILIGVNDIWHMLNGKYDGTVETYENDYRALLERTKKALPEITLVICEPFVLKCGAVNENWFPAFDGYRTAAKKVSDDFGAIFVPFQSMFDEAVQHATPNHFAGDGVHPSPYGAALMAHTWVRTVLS